MSKKIDFNGYECNLKFKSCKGIDGLIKLCKSNPPVHSITIDSKDVTLPLAIPENISIFIVYRDNIIMKNIDKYPITPVDTGVKIVTGVWSKM